MILLKYKTTEGIALDYESNIADKLCLFSIKNDGKKYIMVKTKGHYKKRWQFEKVEVIGKVDKFDFGKV